MRKSCLKHKAKIVDVWYEASPIGPCQVCSSNAPGAKNGVTSAYMTCAHSTDELLY